MIIVCDFDGVLGDSINECLFSSYNTYQSINNRGKRIDRIDQINPKLRARFIELRPYIKSGEDYLLILHIIENNIKIKNNGDFDQVKENKRSLLPRYKKALYQERDLILKKDPKLWLNLNPLFEIGYFFKQNRKFNNMFILTTKRKDYVVKILDHKKAEFPKAHIFHTHQDDKISNLLAIIKNNKVSPKDCIFVEDQVDYLIKAKKLGIKDAIEIIGSGQASDSLALTGRKSLTEMQATKEAAKKAYAQAGVQTKDIDFAEVHDCFTIAEILAIEGLGFFKQGEGGKATEKGKTAFLKDARFAEYALSKKEI